MQCPSEEEIRSLLEWARQAIVLAVSESQLPASIPKDGIFGERHGVFVTLHVGGRLRGCIGVIESQEPLGQSIVRCATGAALRDPRFSPLLEEELEELEIEISLLSPVGPIHPDEIEIGRHGLLIAYEKQRGLLLPQVATEHRLNRKQFLEEACRKAGLPRRAWSQDDVQILGFTCEVFSEGRRGSKE
jgi:AmmeMemoRadiSam system protein A